MHFTSDARRQKGALSEENCKTLKPAVSDNNSIRRSRLFKKEGTPGEGGAKRKIYFWTTSKRDRFSTLLIVK